MLKKEKRGVLVYYAGLLLLLLGATFQGISEKGLVLSLTLADTLYLTGFVLAVASYIMKGDNRLGVRFFSRHHNIIEDMMLIAIAGCFLIEILMWIQALSAVWNKPTNLMLIFSFCVLIINSREGGRTTGASSSGQ